MSEFWEETLPAGYYDNILLKGLKKNRGIQPNWHNLTFIEVSKLINQDSKHLDYACGPGTLVGNYLKCDSIGVDISDKQIDYAKNKYGKNFYTIKEFDKIPKNEKKFDVITILGLFEFLTDEEILFTVNKLHEMLNEGGKIIFTTLNNKSSMKYLEKIISLFGPVDYGHQHINKLSISKLSRLFQNINFQDIEIKKIHNYGIFFSFITINFGKIINNFFKKFKITNNGFLILGVLKKL